MIKCEKDGNDDYMSAFLKRYKTEFGFTLQNRSVLVDDVRVRGVGCTDLDTDLDEIGQGHDITEEPHPIETVQVFFDDHYEATKVYNLDQLPIGHKLQGRVNTVTEFHDRKLNEFLIYFHDSKQNGAYLYSFLRKDNFKCTLKESS